MKEDSPMRKDVPDEHQVVRDQMIHHIIKLGEVGVGSDQDGHNQEQPLGKIK